MAKNRDRRAEHREQKRVKMTFHQWKMLERAIEEIRKYDTAFWEERRMRYGHC